MENNIPTFPSHLAIMYLVMALKKRKKDMNSEDVFQRSWVSHTSLHVKETGIKMTFYWMSSPVSLWHKRGWHSIRIIIPLETNLFACYGASQLILCLNSGPHSIVDWYVPVGIKTGKGRIYHFAMKYKSLPCIFFLLYLMSVNELLFSLTEQCSNKNNIALSALPC